MKSRVNVAGRSAGMPPGRGSTRWGRALVAACLVASIGASLDGCTRRTAEATAAASAAPSESAVATAPASAAPSKTMSHDRTPAASAAPRAMPTFAALASPAPTPTPTGSGSPPPAASGEPRIVSVDTSPDVVHAGDNVSWSVRTSADIVSVSAHVATYTIPLRRASAGRFVLNFVVPANVPAFFHGTYALDVIGATSAGATAKRTVSMTFR